MSSEIPTNTSKREELRLKAESKMQGLIDGRISPKEAREWADAIYFENNNQILIEQNKSLAELFYNLQICDETHNGTTPMFDKTSYSAWYKEYKQLYHE